MFDQIWNDASVQLNTVRDMIMTGDALRELVASREAETLASTVPSVVLGRIVASAPDLTAWRVYEHSGAITRIYAIYERFIGQLISAWLSKLPSLVEHYEELEERLRKEHQLGIGKLLTRLDRRRFRRLSPQHVVSGLHDGLSGAASYQLIPEAFLNTDYNYRADVLNQTFSSVGIDGVLEWVISNRHVRRFITEVRGDTVTVESELRNFIEYRNDAAHGYVDTVLSTDALTELIDFIQVLCAALYEAVSNSVLKHLMRRGEITDCGEITEYFRRPQAVVALLEHGEFSVGDSIFLYGDHYCRTVEISSIQIDSIDQPIVRITASTEVGFKLGNDVHKGLRIFK